MSTARWRLIALEGNTDEEKYQEQRNVIRFTSVQTGCVVKPKAMQCRYALYARKQKPDLPRSFNTSPQMAAQWNSFLRP